MQNKYILLRHGETKYQAQGLKVIPYTEEDKMSLPITESGRKKIEEDAKELKSKNIDFIYSSDFLRTRQTAEIVSKETGVEIVFDKRLEDIEVDGSESIQDVKKRAVSVIENLEKKYKNKTILIVSHGDPLRTLMDYFCLPENLYPETGQYFDLTNL